MRPSYRPLFAVLTVFAGCSSPLDTSAGKYDTQRYELCDGSDDIRLAVVSDGGGPLHTAFAFTNPYGHGFVFVTGKCEFLVGGTLMESMRRGTLTEARARELEAELALTELPAWSSHRDEACPDAGVFYLRSAQGYGECSCGCDDDAPEGLEAALNAADSLHDEFTAHGVPIEGAVELVALISEQEPMRTYRPWPFSWSVADIAEPSGTRAEAWSVHVLEGADAVTARELRESASWPGEFERVAHVHTNESAFYDLFIREQVPAPFAQAITELGKVGM